MTVKKLEIKIFDETLKEVDALKDALHAPSRSDAIRQCVEITSVLKNYAQKGAKIFIEKANGETRKITLMGLER